MNRNGKGKLSAATEKLIDQIIAKLSLPEKCSLLTGKDTWATVALPQHGIESLIVTDGPHGVRTCPGCKERKLGPATYFPTGVAMASTWNTELIRQTGVALAEETRAYGCDVLLGPCVNIVRSPLAGRNFESMSEDPFLAGRIAAGWIDGVQSQGVGASLKHFACNNQETERLRGSSNVDERTMREIYLAQFEYAIKTTQPWTVMCSYNRINGVYASQNEFLLTKILRDEWGFEGLVVSDWCANHTIFESVAAGLDLEMPGGRDDYFRHLAAAVKNWQIPEAKVNRAVRNVLRLLAKTGHLGKDGKIISGAANTHEHQHLARKVAAEAITLLKNERRLLPLNPKKIKKLAVFGYNAMTLPQGGGSSAVPAPYRIAPLDAITSLLGSGVQVQYRQGCKNTDNPENVPIDNLSAPNGKKGIMAEYFANPDWQGKPAGIRLENSSDVWWLGEEEKAPAPNLQSGNFSGRWRTTYTARESATMIFGIDIQGSGRLFLDGELLFETQPVPPEFNWGSGSTIIKLTKGKKYNFCIEFRQGPAKSPMHVKFFQRNTKPEEIDKDDLKIAAAADAVIVFAGDTEGHESEGSDRKNMRLGGLQNLLIEKLLAVNPKTVVVLNTGAPVDMPWSDSAPAILQAYYSGQEGGNAIADILFGKINPSGKLSVSYPRRYQDTPAFLNFPGGREVNYGEGIFVGYRYYDTKGIAPLFPFGHGLSYTDFEYSNLQVPAKAAAGDSFKVKMTIKNTGKTAGQEVVQLYVSDPESSVIRPEKELKGFVKVSLKAGESKVIEFDLDARSFAFYDVDRHEWVVEPGKFVIMSGSSSRDIRLQSVVQLQ